MIVRRLEAKDAEEWKRLRLISLQENPEAFLSSLEVERDRPLEGIVQNFATSLTFGAFDGDTMIGQLSAVPERSERMSHRVWINAVFVHKDHRASGVAQDMLEASEQAAKDAGHLQFELHVAADNARAISFYKRNGFQQRGVIPRATLHEGRYQDDLYMVCRLDTH